MPKIELTHGIRLSMIGKCNDRPYNNPATPHALFCKADLLIDCGRTKKNEFSLGQDGVLNIMIENYKFHDTKAGILASLEDESKSIDQYREDWAWRNYCKDQGHIFTGAFMNCIYKKTASVKVWFHSEWRLRTNKERVLIHINALKKPVHAVEIGGKKYFRPNECGTMVI